MAASTAGNAGDTQEGASCFWARAWGENLTRYGDFKPSLAGGKEFVDGGLVAGLQIETGIAQALVQGNVHYDVTVEVTTLPRSRWDEMLAAGGGQSITKEDLLTGSLPDSVKEALCHSGKGLIPSPDEMALVCSCPDWAEACVHVAAVLIDIGGRLEANPEQLFQFRGVDLEGLATETVTNEPVRAPAGAAPASPESPGEQVAEASPVTEEPPAPETVKVPEPPASRKRDATRKTRAAAPAKKGRTRQARKTPEPSGDVPPDETAPFEAQVITAAELTSIGISNTRIQNWLRSGGLERTEVRGAYLTTSKTKGLVEKALDL